jgi:hypothetical protein
MVGVKTYNHEFSMGRERTVVTGSVRVFTDTDCRKQPLIDEP